MVCFYNYSARDFEDITMIIIYFVISFLVSLVLFIIFGYLWNYYVVRELRRLNESIQSLDNSILSVKNSVAANNFRNPNMVQSNFNQGTPNAGGYNGGNNPPTKSSGM